VWWVGKRGIRIAKNDPLRSGRGIANTLQKESLLKWEVAHLHALFRRLSGESGGSKITFVLNQITKRQAA